MEIPTNWILMDHDHISVYLLIIKKRYNIIDSELFLYGYVIDPSNVDNYVLFIPCESLSILI